MSETGGVIKEPRQRKRPSFWRFYVENILSLGKENLTKYELPGYCCWRETKVEQDLFGWKVKTELEEFECDSESAARYLEIFMHLGWSEVYAPIQLKDYDKFMPELDALKAKADEVIGNGLQRVFAKPQLKFRVCSGTYQGIYEIPDDADVFGEPLDPTIEVLEPEEDLEEAYA